MTAVLGISAFYHDSAAASSWLESKLAIAVTYYLVLSPIGMALRVMGRDSMSRNFDRVSATYWRARRLPADRDRYLRPF